ncbi:biotin-dependent carboxyltransferase family protein [Pseudomonas knackmussii]|uniref:Biotin-dependent carboxyltransferase family protein n=1 Tax=Pseudomonas knackmussii TaxID=65741 RepID=A0ABY4KQQ7_9PSED|nr:biotin-dependent carboxyltransferase family protein [Pseudomonas knackmussii]UPQ81715.1 biotin-dependent carboxyltransferase family protein [Pseudomonas knackmussii]
MSLLIERSGAMASLQDGGRFGVRHLGVTQGGAADWISQAWANWLLGNELHAATIEITLGNFALLAEADSCLALCGADLAATLDGQPLEPGRSFNIRKGQRLAFAQPRRGVRAYLAAPGGFAAPLTLDSCATVRREALGGLHGDGQPLAQGDRLQWSGAAPRPRELDADSITPLSSSEPLQVVLGAQIGDFSGQSLFDAFNSEWTVDQRADRMGIRLLGPVLRSSRQSMISEGVPLGAIQVPPDGQPIVLLNDRQTIGGYPRLGALTPLAVARLAQCMPGTALRLKPIALEAAQRQQSRLLANWR